LACSVEHPHAKNISFFSLQTKAERKKAARHALTNVVGFVMFGGIFFFE
jgi:hypothetical protein